MSEYDWILRGERAKTRKPKGQYLYDELKSRSTGIIHGRESAEYQWRKEHQTNNVDRGSNSEEPRIDFQGPRPESVLEDWDEQKD